MRWSDGVRSQIGEVKERCRGQASDGGSPAASQPAAATVHPVDPTATTKLLSLLVYSSTCRRRACLFRSALLASPDPAETTGMCRDSRAVSAVSCLRSGAGLKTVLHGEMCLRTVTPLDPQADHSIVVRLERVRSREPSLFHQKHRLQPWVEHLSSQEGLDCCQLMAIAADQQQVGEMPQVTGHPAASALTC